MRFLRYLGVQVAAYAIDMGTFLACLYVVAMEPLPANIAGKLLAGAFAFFAHRAFTFRTRDQAASRQAVGYAALLALNIPLSSGVLAVVMMALPMPAAAKFVSDALCIVVTYALSQRFVFGPKPDPRPAGPGAP